MAKPAVLLYRVGMPILPDPADGSGPDLSDQDLRVHALASLVTERGRVDSALLDSFIDVYVSRLATAGGAAPPLPVPTAADVTDAALGARAMTEIPRDGDGPLFRARWEALAFVLTMMLEQRGVFSWLEWADTLGATIRVAAPGTAYYEAWLDGLERIVVHKEIADRATLTRYQHAWDQAAARTPPGTAITLRPEDFA